jgi:hypothetical protein
MSALVETAVCRFSNRTALLVSTSISRFHFRGAGAGTNRLRKEIVAEGTGIDGRNGVVCPDIFTRYGKTVAILAKGCNNDREN